MVDLTLNIFYEEPNPDRWFKYDHYIRNIIRRIIRGKQRPGGQMMVAINLLKGLEKIDIPYRFNDYAYAKSNPDQLVCIIGKPHLVFEKRLKNPIVFGASVFSHPLACPDFFKKYPNVKKMLIPGDWMRNMFSTFYDPQKLVSWPVGIDTYVWNESPNDVESVDFLIYDKIRWERDKYVPEILDPIKLLLHERGYTYDLIRYGFYKPDDLVDKLKKSKAVIFLCEHETQGIAYQQILSTNTPILAWDRGGFWQDPDYYPEKVKYEGQVSSVPYWDDTCGTKFETINDFETSLLLFLEKAKCHKFSPRNFILEHLTLEKCAKQFYDIVTQIKNCQNV